ncbi:MAG: type III-A CRISPR-associated RAMP protein Csm5 [Limosilactobacillus mucosae]
MTAGYHEYRLRLIAMAPVHIGSGETYTAKNYIYENENYYFPNMGKMYLKLRQYPGVVEAFEKFLVNPSRRSNRLVDFLHQYKIMDRDFGGYKIPETGYESAKRGHLNEIHAFVKDGYGNAYIPGSSLKGALRTILVNERFGNDNIAWGGVDDIFNEIRVSDSEPISVDKLRIVQKWDLNRKKFEPKGLPLFREAIRPQTKIDFTITTTTVRAEKLIDQLPQMAKRFYERYEKQFLCDFPDKYVQPNHFLAPLYLGAGSGLWTKVDYEHVDLRGIQRRSYWKMKLKGKGVMKLTCYKRQSLKQIENGKQVKYMLINNDDHYYEMGKCGFKLQKKN